MRSSGAFYAPRRNANRRHDRPPDPDARLRECRHAERGGRMSELHDIDRRVAVLEQIAANTRDALQDIRGELRAVCGRIRARKYAVCGRT